MTTVDEALRALAHPVRRTILELTLESERGASELAETVRMSRPATSQHLRTLLDARLVRVRVDGRRRYYRADGEAIARLRQELALFWEPRLDRLRAEVAGRAARR